MLYNAKNGTVAIENADMDYIAFGTGSRALVMLPGVGDGLKTVKGTAGAFSMLYREYAEKFRVYVLSRRNNLPEGWTTRDMARDVKAAMDALGISRADVFGVSQGGMIAQCLAIDYPERVERLVLAVTAPGPNGLLEGVVSRWVDMAGENDYRGIFIDTMERSYTESYVKRYRALYPVLTRVGKPKELGRFIIQARSCVSHEVRGELGKIKCPALIIGAEEDRILGAEASRELAEGIAGAELYIYPLYGHGVYEEAGDFNARVIGFLTGELKT